MVINKLWKTPRSKE